MKQNINVVQIKNNRIHNFFIFLSDLEQRESIEKITNLEPYKEYIPEIYYNILQDDLNRNTPKIGIYRVYMNILQDDIIFNIKRKIVYANNLLLERGLSSDDKISFQELYIYGLKKMKKRYTMKELYKMMTQNNKIPLTYIRLLQFLINIYRKESYESILSDITIREKLEGYDEDHIFSYEDFLELSLDFENLNIHFNLGRKYMAENEYPISVNPYNVVEYDPFLISHSNDILSTQNSQVLLDYPKLVDNTIFFTTALQVYEYNERNSISQTNTTKVYFPFLNELNILNKNDLLKRKDELIKNTVFGGLFTMNNKKVDLFHEIYTSRENDLEYLEQGIQKVDFMLYSENTLQISLLNFFKLLKTNKTTPFIKYNPGVRKENMYRLYSNATSKNGKKIPLLSKSKINKLKERIAKGKSVGSYTHYKLDDGISYDCVIHIFSDLSIQFTIESKNVVKIKNIEEIVRKLTNEFLTPLYDYLKEQGFNVNKFLDLKQDRNIDILNISYYSRVPIQYKLTLQRLKHCISSVFNVIQTDIKKGIDMRYKRVSHYNKMDSIEALIVELIQLNVPEIEIVNRVSENFSLSYEEARKEYLNWLSSVQVQQQTNRNRKLKIKSHPGFPCRFSLEPYTKNLIIEIENMNNIRYLDILPIYIDSIIRISEDSKNKFIKNNIIQRICKSAFEEETVDVQRDIQSKVDTALERQEDFSIQNEELNYDSELDDDDGILGFLSEGDSMTGGSLQNKLNEKNRNIQYSSQVLDSRRERKSEDDDEGITDDEDEMIFEEDEDNEDALGLIFEEDTRQDDDEEEEEDAMVFGEDTQEEKEEDAMVFGEDTQEEEEETEEETEEEKEEEKEEEETEEETDEETEEETEDETEEEKRIDKMERNIVGMNLTGTNYFLKRLQDRDERLFLKTSDGKYNSYSRICPFNVRRQPVILTQEEKDNIDKNHPGSYDKAIHYGSDENHKHWYICPRFWCLKTNTSMTEEEVKAGKCGGSSKIIPPDAKTVPKDAFVFEFNHDKQHRDKNGNYVQHNPGFVKDGNHPKGLCIPCCFKGWDSTSQRKRREECLEDKKTEDREIRMQDADYIKNPDKFPLTKNRWGMLPLSVQKLLHTDNSKCMRENRNRVKPFTYCMLRKGIENSDSQSFIALIADVYVDYLREKKRQEGKRKEEIQAIKVPTIEEMKSILSNAITLDNFIGYFNGALIRAFAPKKGQIKNINIDSYLSSNLAKQLNIESRLENEERNQEEIKHFKQLCSSYENYIQYIQNENEIIDHTYLWDVITTPNNNLFPNGTNLVLLNIPDDDMTNNIELVCPTNSYSSVVFDSDKPTLLALLKDKYYEPIYLYRDEEIEINVNKLFHKKNSHLLSNIRYVLQVINQGKDKCKPLPSIPRVYQYKQNKYLSDIKELFKTNEIKILRQVSNYSNKIIGLYVRMKETDETGYVPIKPSAIDPKYKVQYFDNDELFTNLTNTIQFLKKVYKKTGKNMAIKPIIKVIEDELIVGIITNGNQFVPIKEPEENIIFMELEEQKGTNFLIADKKVSLSDKVDEEREKVIQRIKLENSFYNSFRNTARILLNLDKNANTKIRIQNILEQMDKFYTKKIKNIKKELKKIIEDNVVFKEIQEENLLKIGKVSSCYYMNERDKCESIEYCMIRNDSSNICKLIIPSINLISNYNNESLYYTRLADEIIRYKDIYNYLFNENIYLSNLHIDYNLTKNEIILLETILDTYFDDIIEERENRYITYKVGEFTQPNKTEEYNNNFTIDELMMGIEDKIVEEKKVERVEVEEEEKKIEEDTYCVSKREEPSKGKWKTLLKNPKERTYSNIEPCTFHLLKDIYQNYTGKKISVHKIKKVLIKEYNKVIEVHGRDKIINKILIDEGKHLLMKQILEDKITIEDTIISENYYITNFDIILFGMKYELPILIVSSTDLNELRGWNIKDELKRVSVVKEKSRYNNVWMIDNTEIKDFYYIIRQPGIKRNVIPEYSLFHRNNSIRIQLDSVSPVFRTQLERIYINRPTFYQYIDKYIRLIHIRKKLRLVPIEKDTRITKIKRKKPIKLVVRDE